jgi:NAD(P)-dependent dehydrogenase (short-subunit alcohol dehydrogenase family)
VLDDFRLDGRVAVVTGGGSGLGRTFALALAEAGAAVAVLGRRPEPLASVVEAVRALGVPGVAVSADVAGEGEVRRAFARIQSELGSVDVLVNNAVAHRRAPVISQPADDWRRVIDVNVMGAFLCCQAVGPDMIARQRGSVINVSSVYGLVGRDARLYAPDDPDSAQSLPYSATKGALIQMTRDLAAMWGRQGVRVNSISPGMFGRVDDREAGLAPELQARLAARTPLGRLGRPQDLRGAVLFLACDASAFVTGHNLVVDGGWTAW